MKAGAMYRPDREALRDFGTRVLTGAARELKLLEAIDRTIDALRWDEKMLSASAAYADETAELIQGLTPAAPLDPDESLRRIFDGAQEAVEAYYHALIGKRTAARHDPHLTDDDGVADAYTAAIAAAADLNNGLNRLRWAIGEHDADLDQPTTEAFSSVEELMARLGH